MAKNKNVASYLMAALAMSEMLPPMGATRRRFIGANPTRRVRNTQHSDLQECARRRKQIAAGTLKKENGLFPIS